MIAKRWPLAAALCGALLLGCAPTAPDDSGTESDAPDGQETGADVELDSLHADDSAEEPEGGPVGDATSQTDSRGPLPDTPVASGPEKCRNGIDDNGDGLVDCEDPLCQAYELCAPNGCANGLDDDGDGLVDCRDPDCMRSEPCRLDSGIDYVFCAVELGCECEIGIDCPDSQPQWNQCQQACQSDIFCNPACLGNQSAQAIAKQQAYIACFQSECADIPEPQANGCFFEKCTEPYAAWLMAGDLTCGEMNVCAGGCGTSTACSTYCFGSMSVAGYLNLAEFQACQRNLCDADGNGEADSEACATVATWACLETGGDCFNLDFAVSGLPCAATFDCLMDCAGLPPGQVGPCINACWQYLDTQHLGGLSDLLSCAIQQCGTAPPNLSLVCLKEAALGACAPAYAACGGTLPPEECDDGKDNDGDSLIDCQDPDCATHESCQITDPVGAVWITDLAQSCTNETDTAELGPDIDAVAILDSFGLLTFSTTTELMGPALCANNPFANPEASAGKLDQNFTRLNGGTLMALFPGGFPEDTEIMIFSGGPGAPVPYAVAAHPSHPRETPWPQGEAQGTAALPLLAP